MVFGCCIQREGRKRGRGGVSLGRRREGKGTRSRRPSSGVSPTFVCCLVLLCFRARTHTRTLGERGKVCTEHEEEGWKERREQKGWDGSRWGKGGGRRRLLGSEQGEKAGRSALAGMEPEKKAALTLESLLWMIAKTVFAAAASEGR